MALARITGMTTWQDVPLSGTLRIYPQERYEDGQGNATPGRYDCVLDVVNKRWKDERLPSADVFVVVAGGGEPRAVEAVFEEEFNYPAGQVKHIYRKYLQTSDLNATEFDYTQPQNVRQFSGGEGLTMQAARELLAQGGELIEQQQTALADIAQDRAQLQDAITTIGVVNSSLNGLQIDGLLYASDGTPYYDVTQNPAASQPVTLSATSGGSIYYLPGGQ